MIRKGLLLPIVGMIILFSFFVNSEPEKVGGGVDISTRKGEITFYDSEPYIVNEYDIEKVIQKAKELGYTIKFSDSCLGISVGECKSNGWFKEEVEEGSPNKLLSVSTIVLLNEQDNKYSKKTYIALNVAFNDFEFSAAPKDRLKDPYMWQSIIMQKDENLNITTVSNIVAEELRAIGVVDEGMELYFERRLIPPDVILQDPPIDNKGGRVYFQDEVFILILVVVMIFILIVVLILKSRLK